jgi:hypothetical protein
LPQIPGSIVAQWSTGALDYLPVWENADNAVVAIVAHVGPTKARAIFSAGLSYLDNLKTT